METLEATRESSFSELPTLHGIWTRPSEIRARDKPLKRLDAFALAKRTKEFSGADLKSIFDLATERALSRAMKEGRVVPLTTEDLLQACKGMKPSTRAWFERAKNYALYANQGGFYDDVLSFLGIRR